MPPTTRLQSRGESTPSKSPQNSSPDSGSAEKRGAKKKKVSFVGQLTFVQVVSLGAVAGLVMSSLLTYVVLREHVRLEGKTKLDQVKTFPGKLEFALRYQVLGVSFILLALFRVVLKRVTSPAIDPLSGYEYLTLESRNILTNSMESFVLSLVSQLILLTHLAPGEVLKIIPLVNVLYLFGRIAFLLGYPKYRTCGFVTTIGPILVMNAMNLYRFGQHLGLY